MQKLIIFYENVIFLISDKSLNTLYDSNSFVVFSRQALCKLSIAIGIRNIAVKAYAIIPINANPGLSITYIPYMSETIFIENPKKTPISINNKKI